MPSPLSLVQALDVVTGPFAYVRLLGDRDAVDALTPTLDHIVLDSREQVAEDAAAIRWLRGRVPVLALVNNHFAGYAPPRPPASSPPSPPEGMSRRPPGPFAPVAGPPHDPVQGLGGGPVCLPALGLAQCPEGSLGLVRDGGDPG
jgi:hypothetical protein